MNDPQTKTDIESAEQEVVRKKPTLARQVGRAMIVFVAVPYIIILALMFIFQRKLIYHPGPSVDLQAERLDQQNVLDISVSTDENLIMNGWHYHPLGIDGAKQLDADDWLVLFFHGNAGNRSTRTYLCEPLSLSHNLHVMICDYRGYGDNTGSPSEQALCADAEALWRFAIEQKGASPERIILYGQSLGGGVATHLAAHACEQNHSPGGLVLTGTFSSLADAAQRLYPAFPVRWMLFDQFDSAAKMPAVTCPVVQLHGRQDEIIPFAIGEKLYAATPMQSADGIPKQFITLDNVGHNNMPVSEIVKAIVSVTKLSP